MPSVDSIAKPKQRAALKILAEEAKGYRLIEAPFVALPDSPVRSLRALMLKDFIVASSLTGTVKYKITSRGLKALSEIERIENKWIRQDGLCRNKCGRPVYVSPQGVKKGICRECMNAAERARYARVGDQCHADKPCSRSGCEKPRHVFSTGRVSRYCLDCTRAGNQVQQRQYRRRVIERIVAGEKVMCRHCHDRSARLTANGNVKLYCLECSARLQSLSRKRRMLKRYQTRIRINA